MESESDDDYHEVVKAPVHYMWLQFQQTFTFIKSAIETLDKDMKYVQS